MQATGTEEGHKCTVHLTAVEDALYVIGGKWKLRIIVALREMGKLRFNELQRTVTGISARVLSNELKELEMNGFVARIVHTSTPVLVEYQVTDYSRSLNKLLKELVNWGHQHREVIRKEMKSSRANKK